MEAFLATYGWWFVAILLMGVGFAGMILPGLPGAPVLFAGMFVGAWIDDFELVGVGTVVALGAMAAATYAVDFAAGALGASRFGASRRGMIGAAVGAFVGLFFGLLGVLVGPFVGAVLGELSAQRALPEAGRAGLGASLGLALGAAAKLALGFSMFGIFVLARIF